MQGCWPVSLLLGCHHYSLPQGGGLQSLQASPGVGDAQHCRASGKVTSRKVCINEAPACNTADYSLHLQATCAYTCPYHARMQSAAAICQTLHLLCCTAGTCSIGAWARSHTRTLHLCCKHRRAVEVVLFYHVTGEGEELVLSHQETSGALMATATAAVI